MIVHRNSGHFNTVAILIGVTTLSGLANTQTLFAQDEPQLALSKTLLLHASFDTGTAAEFALGDRQLYSSKSTKRDSPVTGLRGAVTHVTEGGRLSGCLKFEKKSNWFPFFKGERNFPMPQPGKPFGGTVSFWMKLDPARDLPPGFVDPIQITDKKWNDASFFLDFTKDNPRQFRLGAYSNYKFWNPKAAKYDEIPDSKRPLGALKNLPFARDRWTHLAFTWSDFNTERAGEAKLFVDGKQRAVIRRPQQFNWEPQKVGIMLGIFYVGQIDELTVLSTALPQKDITRLFKQPDFVRSLYPPQ